ncbi:MAG: thiamine phosphate synthase [Oscillospiraceae bacterium]|jgi:thiamine-phosphate pyrophosphorylase
MKDFDLSLYLVTDSTGLEDENFLSIVNAACAGGITFLQLREKERSAKDFLSLAEKVKAITDKYKIPLIIDDRADIALACDAAGVHIGQSDLPVFAARKALGQNKIVGTTAKTVSQALSAQEQGADYLGVGAIFPTTTKVVTIITKVSTLDEIIAAVNIPVAAIGGLNAENMSVLENSKIDGIAVVSAIMKAADPFSAAKMLKSKIMSLKQ